MTINEIKQTLGENTEKVEKQAKEYLDKYYSEQEPWKRGLMLLGVLTGTVIIIYWLTKEDTSERKKAKQEFMMEERLLKRMELLKRLKE